MTVTWLLFLITDGSPEMASGRWQVTPSTARRCTDCESRTERRDNKQMIYSKEEKIAQLTCFNLSLFRYLKGNKQLTDINPNAFVGCGGLSLL